jgi:hypothetical protein
MNKKIIEQIQRRVESLLLTLSDDLQTAAKDQCSEAARLVGCWILDESPEYKAQIFKGAFSDGSAHDILAVESKKEVFLIDPTVWQMFPESSSIFVGSVGNTSEAINLLQRKYAGTWGVSEVMQKCDQDYQQELLRVIRSNK